MGSSGYVRRDWAQAPLWRDRAPLLSHLDIELTERCNNRCLHCCVNLPANDAQARGRELGSEQWQRLLSEAAQLGALTVRMTGGEPLLREDFSDLYLFSRRLGLRVLLFTNSRLITPALADQLARTPPLEPVEVTAYGMHRESYEAVSRAPGSFAQFRAGIGLLQDRGIPFVIKGTLLPPTIPERPDFEAWAATNSATGRRPGYVCVLDLRRRRDSDGRNRAIAGLRLEPAKAASILWSEPDTHRREIAQFCAAFAGRRGEDLFQCGAGQRVAIDPYGVLHPCLELRHPALAYDLKAGSLRQGVAETLPRLLKKKATNPEYLARCARCFLGSLCQQCPAKSWAEHGTLDTPVEYFCQIAHAEARHVGLLAPEEKAWEVSEGAERIKRLERL